MKRIKLTPQLTVRNLTELGIPTGQIVHITNQEEWVTCGDSRTPAYCSYNFDDKTTSIYGHLFNWFAIKEIEKHLNGNYKIPTRGDFKSIQAEFGGEHEAGKSLKSTDNWLHPSAEDGVFGNGNNESGYAIQPAGIINENGFFMGLHEDAYLWSSEEDSWEDLNPLREALNVPEENIEKDYPEAFAYGLTFYDNSFLEYVMNKCCGSSIKLIIIE